MPLQDSPCLKASPRAPTSRSSYSNDWLSGKFLRTCQTLKVQPSGYYAWLAEPQSARVKEDQRLLGLIKHAWLESGGVYGYRKVHDDLRELGEKCGRNRVGRFMQVERLRPQTGYFLAK